MLQASLLINMDTKITAVKSLSIEVIQLSEIAYTSIQQKLETPFRPTEATDDGLNFAL